MSDILINFPTNLGDTILSLPVLDRIRFNYPQAKITAIASPKTKDFLLSNNFIDEIVVFDKFWKAKEKIRFSLSLRKKYDLVVDLKNSFLPVIISPKKRTPFYRPYSKESHIKDIYLELVKKLAPHKATVRSKFIIEDKKREKLTNLNLSKSVFVACSSKSSLKRYPYSYLKRVIELLLEKGYSIVILGEEEDRSFYRDILNLEGITDLVGKTTISEVVYLLENYALLVLCVDSSIMHLASYLNLPIVAIFGPTSYKKYGPWSSKAMILYKKELSCLPCEKSFCSTNLRCMEIEPYSVLDSVMRMIQKIKF
jgi:ADP-heptose:LPS heptosyltransferase